MDKIKREILFAMVLAAAILVAFLQGRSVGESVAQKYTAEIQTDGMTFAVQCEVAQLKEGNKRTLVILGVADRGSVGYVTHALVEYYTTNPDSNDKWAIDQATKSYGATPGGRFPDSGEGVAIRDACIQAYPDMKAFKVRMM